MGHRLTAFGNVSQSGSLLLRRTPHCPTRKNSVVNNQKLKKFYKKFDGAGCFIDPLPPKLRVSARHPHRRKSMQKIGGQTLAKSVR